MFNKTSLKLTRFLKLFSVVNIDADKNKEVENQKETPETHDVIGETLENPPDQEGGAVVSSCEPTLTDASEQKQMEEIQIVQTPEDTETSTTNILNKMVNEEQDSINKSDSASANKSSFSEGLSTVIIVKKVSSVAAAQPTQEIDAGSKESNSSNQSKVNKENLSDDVSPNKTSSAEQGGFTAVKPKLVEKEETKEESLNTSSTLQQVTCELCFQQYESYSHLVRHVRKQHRDCTFVRNYLEEIRPLTITPCPICKRNFTAKSSLDAHLKVSHGGQFVRIRNLPAACSTKQVASNTSQPRPAVTETKKRASKEGSVTADRDKTSLTPLGSSKVESESDEDSDSSLEEVINGKQRVKCDVCNESFETRQQALKHQDRVHRRQARSAQRDTSASSDLFACKYCNKRLRTKELLLKHCLGTHFKSNSSKKNKQQQSASEEDLVESEDNEMIDEEEEVRKTSLRKRARIEKSDQGPSRSGKRAHAGKNPSAGSASSPDAHGASGFVCDLCGMDFNRMTLLVTHARYCRKSTALK